MAGVLRVAVPIIDILLFVILVAAFPDRADKSARLGAGIMMTVIALNAFTIWY